MVSVITNIYTKKTYLNVIVHIYRKTEKVFFFWQIEMFDVCTTGDTSNLSSCQKKTFSVFLWLWTIPFW
jgi:hypothetical protein